MVHVLFAVESIEEKLTGSSGQLILQLAIGGFIVLMSSILNSGDDDQQTEAPLLNPHVPAPYGMDLI